MTSNFGRQPRRPIEQEYQNDHEGEPVEQPTYNELLQFMDYVWEYHIHHSAPWMDYFEDWKENQ